MEIGMGIYGGAGYQQSLYIYIFMWENWEKLLKQIAQNMWIKKAHIFSHHIENKSGFVTLESYLIIPCYETWKSK